MQDRTRRIGCWSVMAMHGSIDRAGELRQDLWIMQDWRRKIAKTVFETRNNAVVNNKKNIMEINLAKRCVLYYNNLLERVIK